MADPLGLIGNSGMINRPGSLQGAPGTGTVDRAANDGPGFKEMLQEQIAHVNALHKDAKEATEDYMAKRRFDPEAVIVATQKADLAFQLLLQVRNKMMDAYEEVKQVRI